MGIQIAKRLLVAITATCALTSGAVLHFAPTSAAAQTQNPPNDTLIISPPITERNVAPGNEFSYTVSLTNQSNRVRGFTARATNAKPLGDSGSSDLVPDEGPYAVASWVTLNPSNAQILPNQKLDVNVTVRIPANAGPGSHFGGILFSPAATPSPDGAAVDVRAEISSLLLVTVSGQTTNDLQLKSFDTNKTFYNNKDVTFTSRYTNNGNVVASPTGTITIKNIFGKKVKEIKVDPQRVLPTAERKFESSWKEDSMLFGPYSATLEWTANGQGSSPTKIWFYGTPTNVLIPVAVVLVLLFLLVWLPRKRLKRAVSAFKQSSSE